jgi:superfamily II DNA/RNA helicase
MYNKTSITSFTKFGFSTEILSAISEVGYEKPTHIQQAAIPKILEGRDVLAGAETGSGKTAAFVLPVLHALTRHNDAHAHYGPKKETVRPHQVRALILVPTRELAIQIGQEITKFSKHIEPHVKCLSVYGGVKIEQPIKDLRGGTDFLIATPGRFLDLIKAKAIKFNQLQTLVLDEVDRLVSTGFKEEIEQITKFLPNKRQNLFFTATFPDEIRPLVREVLDNPEIIKQDQQEKELIDQRVLTVNFDKKTALLVDLLEKNDWTQVLIFCSAKRSCDNLVEKLSDKGINAFSLHGNKKQHERRDVLKDFKAGSIRIIVATDVAARGLDIVQLPCVINYELPRSPNDYVHRIGRTGRAGKEGMAISLISHHEYQHFTVIEKRNGLRLPWEVIEDFQADEIAPPPPQRSRPKKTKSKKRPSKKQVKRNNPMGKAPEIEDQHQPPQKSVSPYKMPVKKAEAKEKEPENSVKKQVASPYKTPIKVVEEPVKKSLDKPVSQEPDSPYKTSTKKLSDKPTGEKAIPIPSNQPTKTTSDDEPKKPKVNASIWGRKATQKK